MLSKISTAVCSGMNGQPVTVETDISSGLPSISIVGLASTTVQEAKERIRTAILNSEFRFPRGRITINLRPANFRKNSSCLDLPIAVGILASAMYVDLSKAGAYGMIGELSLDGGVVGVDGVMPIVQSLVAEGIRNVIVPYSNYAEASLISGCKIVPVWSLAECTEIINGTIRPEIDGNNPMLKLVRVNSAAGLDYGDIRGQENAKRAIVVAVTGRHGLLMVGSPGCGKTMLARRIPTIMPPMSSGELIETAIVNSVMGYNRDGNIYVDRPFRSPHSTIGRAGLLGGGIYPIPGEITLAHNGVLFLDEVCEFDRESIEALRGPVEEKKITHFRKGLSYTFPCNFQMVMASNPCKCGYYGDSEKMCICSQSQLEQYRRKLSGPMMDRIDMRINMERVSFTQMSGHEARGTTSDEMKKAVQKGLEFAEIMGRKKGNALLNDNEVKLFCSLDDEEELFMKKAYQRMQFSPRSYNRILKVARTIADLDSSERITTEHLAEAMSYRMVETINES